MRGSTGLAPTRVLDHEGLAAGGKRWRFIPLRERLATTSARPAALPSNDYSAYLNGIAPDDTNFSYFSSVLDTQKDDNITESFKCYLRAVQPLSLSLPLIVRNRGKLVDTTLTSLKAAATDNLEGVAPVAKCLAALATDLGSDLFNPLFSVVMEAISAVLAKYDSNQPHESGKLSLALLWDPELCLVPVFTAVAHITKLLVSRLAVYPEKTVGSLKALLGSQHYRIREMTAESSVGFIVRKTRDSEMRDGFVRTLVLSAYDEISPNQDELVDGLGVSLFEAVRLPSGRLHSRATDVLSAALRTLQSESNHDMEPKNASPSIPTASERYLQVVARFLASLCTYVQVSKDAQSVVNVLLTEAHKAKKKRLIVYAGYLAFLVRCFFTHGGTKLCTLLPPALIEKIIASFSVAIDGFSGQPKILCESLWAIASLRNTVPESFRRKSIPNAVLSCLSSATASENPKALRCVLNAVVFLKVSEWNYLNNGILARAFSAACEKLVRLHGKGSSRETIVYRESFDCALAFVRSISDSGTSQDILELLRMPALEAWVKRATVVRLDAMGGTESMVDMDAEPSLAELLQFLSIVPVTGPETILDKIDTTAHWEPSSAADVVTVCLRQDGGHSNHSPNRFEELARSFIGNLLRSASSLRDRKVVSVVSTFLIRYPHHDLRTFSESGDVYLDFEELEHVLVENLSSDQGELREESLSLLRSFSTEDKKSKESSEQSASEGDETVDDADEVKRPLDLSDSSSGELFNTFVRIAEESQRPDAAISNVSVLLLQDFKRKVDLSPKVDAKVALAVTHFIIGLFRTPLRTLWAPSGDILCSLGRRQPQVVGNLVVSLLRYEGEKLVSNIRPEATHNNEVITAKESDSQLHATTDSSDPIQSVFENEVLGDSEPQNVPTSSKRKRGATDTGKENESRQTKRPRMRNNQRSAGVQNSRSAGNARILWDNSEWKQLLTLKSDVDATTVSNVSDHLRRNRTDSWTLLNEVFKSLAKEPGFLSGFGVQVVGTYLSLAPTHFSKEKGNILATNIVTVLDKLGSVKSCGKDRNLSNLLRARLLEDLSRPNSSLQAAAVKCLCNSPNEPLRLHRDSLIKLTDEKLFKDELSLLSESHFSDWDALQDHNLTPEQDAIVEVLVRICFSKMRSKVGKSDSQRFAVLAFLTSKVPQSAALPRIVSLVLGPLLKEDPSTADDGPHSIRKWKDQLPDVAVQKGVLKSVESLVKHCRQLMPTHCWEQLGFAVLHLFKSSILNSPGQSVRSQALKILVDMYKTRPEETEFIIAPTLRAVGKSDGITLTATLHSTPTLLRFVAAVCSNASPSTRTLVLTEQWVLQCCWAGMASATAEASAVEDTMIIAKLIVSRTPTDATKGPDDPIFVKLSAEVEETLPHLARALCTQIRRMMGLVASRGLNRKKWSPIFAQGLRTITDLVTYHGLTDVVVIQTVGELLSFVQTSGLTNATKAAVLHALQVVFKASFCSKASIHAPHQSLEEDSETSELMISETKKQGYIAELLPLISNTGFSYDVTTHYALCDLLGSLEYEDLKHVSEILKDLRAVKTSEIDTPDFDRRIEGLNRIISLLKEGLNGNEKCDVGEARSLIFEADDTIVTLSANAVVALCHGCVLASTTDDTAIRSSAGYALQLMAHWVSVSDAESAMKSVRTLLQIMLSGTVNAKDTMNRRSFGLALGRMARLSSSAILPCGRNLESTLLAHLRSLSSSDLDVDFFENLVHLQPHRRGRAFRQLQQYLETEKTSTHAGVVPTLAEFVQEFAVPLSLNCALEHVDIRNGTRGARIKHSSSQRDTQVEAVQWAVKLFGRAVGHLEWDLYKTAINRLLIRINRRSDLEENPNLFKLLVEASQSFPGERQLGNPEDDPLAFYLVNSLIPKMLRHVSSGGLEGKLLDHNGKVSLLKESASGHQFRAPVATAIGRLMSRLPKDVAEPLLPLLVTPLAAALRSRMISIRNDSRKALSSVAISMGSVFFHFILRQTLLSLSEGYRKETSVFVCLSLLEAVRGYRKASSENVFAVDDCIEILMPHLMEELQAGTSETNSEYDDPNVDDARRKQTSSRASKACECAEMLGELVNFQMSAKSVCVPILEMLQEFKASILVRRLNNFLSKFLMGLSRNKSFETATTMVFTHFLMAGDVKDGPQAPGDVEDGVQTTVYEKPTLSSPLREYREYHSINLGLKMLQLVLSKNTSVLGCGDDVPSAIISMCEPFLGLCLASLKTGHDDVTLNAFRVLQQLLKLPLRNKLQVASELSNVIVDILSQKSGGNTISAEFVDADELFNTCLRSAAILLKEAGDKSFSTISAGRVGALLQVACNCIEGGSPDSRSAALAILKAVVYLKIVLPSVYDAMEKVNHLCIHSQSSPLRKSCVSLSISFLLNFPMGSRRVRQQLEFFVRNMSYELPSGRLAALQAIRELITRFPVQVLEKESELLFIALAANVAQDSDSECRRISFRCLELIFERLPLGRHYSNLLKVAATLVGVETQMTSLDENILVSKSHDPILQRSGAVSLSAACKSGSVSQQDLRLIVRAIVTSLGTLDVEQWEALLSFLQCLEAAFSAQTADLQMGMRLELQVETDPLWDSIPSLLLHKNQWIRLSSSRLLGSHLSASGGRQAKPETLRNKTSLWNSSITVRCILKALCLQLEATELASDLAQQCLKNVLCMGDVVHKHPSIGDIVDSVNDDEHGEADVSFDAIGTKADEYTPDCGSDETTTNRALRWLVSRISGISMQVGSEDSGILRRGCAIRFLSVTARWWGDVVVRPYKGLYIGPVVKVLESGATSAGSMEDIRTDIPNGSDVPQLQGLMSQLPDGKLEHPGVLRSLSEALQSSILEVLDAQEYYKLYKELSSKRAEMKQDRKRKAAMLLAINPELAARQKRRRTEKRKLKRNKART